MNYIIDVGGSAKIHQIPAPKSDWDSTKTIVETAYAHEQYITKKIHELVALTEAEKDYNPRDMLSWFVTEQIEEESSTLELVERQAAFNNDMLFNQHTTRTTE